MHPGEPAHHAPTERLSSWTPISMTVWPGQVAASIALEGCSLACPYCDRTANRREPVAWEAVLGDIERQRTRLDGVVVTGGEPTEDPDLPSLLTALAQTGLAIRLDTNGTRPDVLWHVLAERLVDFVALDIKAVPERYGSVSPQRGTASLVARSAELVIRSGVAHEFRTTVHPDCVSLSELPRIARSLRGGRLYSLVRLPPASGAATTGSDLPAPYAADELRRAARECHAHLPTIVRGLADAEVLTA